MLEVNQNGTWAINFLQSALHEKRSDVDGDQYLNGDDGLLVECQYGAGEGNQYSAIQSWVNTVTDKQGYNNAMSATCSVYDGYIGSNSRLKCATKLYSTGQDMTHWRDWGDVWSLF